MQSTIFKVYPWNTRGSVWVPSSMQCEHPVWPGQRVTRVASRLAHALAGSIYLLVFIGLAMPAHAFVVVEESFQILDGEAQAWSAPVRLRVTTRLAFSFATLGRGQAMLYAASQNDAFHDNETVEALSAFETHQFGLHLIELPPGDYYVGVRRHPEDKTLSYALRLEVRATFSKGAWEPLHVPSNATSLLATAQESELIQERGVLPFELDVGQIARMSSIHTGGLSTFILTASACDAFVNGQPFSYLEGFASSLRNAPGDWLLDLPAGVYCIGYIPRVEAVQAVLVFDVYDRATTLVPSLPDAVPHADPWSGAGRFGGGIFASAWLASPLIGWFAEAEERSDVLWVPAWGWCQWHERLPDGPFFYALMEGDWWVLEPRAPGWAYALEEQHWVQLTPP